MLAVAISVDGQYLASAESNGTAKLWDITTPVSPKFVSVVEQDKDDICAVVSARRSHPWPQRTGTGRQDCSISRHCVAVLGGRVADAKAARSSVTRNGSVSLSS